MRILTLSQYHDPEPNFKGGALERELVRRGHQVTALTAFPHYPQGKIYPGFRQRWRQWENDEGVRLLRLPIYADHSRSALKRVLNYGSFAASASLLGPALCGPADAMWVYHPPLTVGIPAWWIGLLRRVPFVYEIQDMWPETLSATGMMSEGRATRIVDKVARRIYRAATAITVISPGFKENLIAKGVSAEKIHVIPNWADEDLYRPVPPDPQMAREFGLEGRFNIMFAGTMGGAQALDNLLEAAALLRDLPAVQFVMIGDGVDQPALCERAKTMGLDNVRFLGRQPGEKMPAFFALADVLLVHLKREPLFEITIPSKTIAYLACGRPILTVTAGDPAQVVTDAGAGLACAPGEPQELARLVREFQAMPAAAREAMGQAGRQAFLQQYTRRVLMDRYEALFREVALSRRAGRLTPAPKADV